tara:strand:+ start:3538 stop:3990 length:453 start_codon:yes stop_codon:yes gene_type:complete
MNISNIFNTYQGIYKNIYFEIKFFEGDSIPYSHGHWVYYIFICLDNLPNRVKPETFWFPLKGTKGFRYYCNYTHKILNEIYFYRGITFYNKICGFEDGQEKIIKVGCDFNHTYDQDEYYTLEDIQVHVKKTIDSLYQVIPEYGKERESKC